LRVKTIFFLSAVLPITIQIFNHAFEVTLCTSPTRLLPACFCYKEKCAIRCYMPTESVFADDNICESFNRCFLKNSTSMSIRGVSAGSLTS